MKSKSMILMVVSLGFGLVAAIGISKVMGGSSGNGAPAVPKGPVLVAVEQFDHGTLLTEENVKVEERTLAIIPPEAVTSLDEIKDMAIMTRLSKGQTVFKTDIVHKDEIQKLAIEPGQKVAGLPVPAEDTLNGLLAPGDKVDVIGVIRITDPQNRQKQHTVSETFLKNLTVFSVGKNMKSGGPRELNGGKKDYVNLIVSERQAEQLVFLKAVANVRLILTNEDSSAVSVDEAVAETDGLFEKLLGGVVSESEQLPLIANAKDEHTMRIYHGGEGETIKFEGDLPVDGSRESTGEVTAGALNDDDSGEFDHSNENESGFE